MTECERCGFPVGWGEHRKLDGMIVCPLCHDELLYDPPELPDKPPAVDHWAWEGERKVANGTG